VAADELADTKVRFNSVRPGLIKTERNVHLTDDEHTRKLFLDEKPLKRLGTVDNVAAAVRYLVGPEASWVTGVSFAVDGGNELRRAPRSRTRRGGITGRRGGDRPGGPTQNLFCIDDYSFLAD
jgi:enoyl-[acyl-carrier-protein] reductase (NADH)